MKKKNITILKFFGKLIVFLGPLVIFWIYLEINLRKIPNSLNVKRSYLEQNAEKIELLNVGSSQALYAFDPHFLNGHYFNLAEVSQTFFYDSRIIQKYLSRMTNLKMVIIPVSYFSFWTQLHDGKEQWRDYYYSQFWDIDYKELKWYDIKRYSLVFLYEPHNALGLARIHFKTTYAENMENNGWVPRSEIGSDSVLNDALGLKRVKLHESLMVPERLPEIVSDLSTLIALLQEKKISVVLVGIPVYETYYKFLNPEIAAKNDSVIHHLCSTYGLHYYDYVKDKRFERMDFFDNDHLNKNGAEKFSQIIRRDIIDPFYQPVKN